MNEKTQNIISISLITLTIVGVAIIIYRNRRNTKKNGVLVQGEYSVPKDIPNRVDALHSFERRKSDGFGGRMSTKIKEEMEKLYKKGINPDVSDIKIDVDSTNYKVKWSAKVHESKDGKAYVGITTFGSAGNNADSRAIGQFEGVKQRVGGEDYKLVLDFKNPKGIYIRQFFYKYTKPNDYKAN